MSETTTGFAKRLGGEFKTFARGKQRELAKKVQEASTKFVSEAENQTYKIALGVVAKHHSLTDEEVESRLGTSKSIPREIK